MYQFCLQSGPSSREKIAVYSASFNLGFNCINAKEYNANLVNCIPVGTVEFCEPFANFKFNIINFFPEFLSSYYKRNIRYVEVRNNENIKANYFYKSANVWKGNFHSRIVNENEIVPDGFYYLSEPVCFEQEWRYYIANGEIITSGWYDGYDDDEPAPSLKIDFPKNYSAAVDFGRLKTGELALVEAHAPFACGWYGDKHEDYAIWQYEAWIGYLNNPNHFKEDNLERFYP